MIGYLTGKVIKKDAERVLLLAGHIGFEVLLPAVVMDKTRDKQPGEDLSLYIYYHQTERLPKPVLIGFYHELEKEFFQHLISVEAIGAIKAAKAFTLPVHEIAAAIESKNAAKLKQLKGIGQRTAQKIIATLRGKMDKFLVEGQVPALGPDLDEDVLIQVLDVLTDQLGYGRTEARKMIDAALRQKDSIATAEALLDQIFRNK